MNEHQLHASGNEAQRQTIVVLTAQLEKAKAGLRQIKRGAGQLRRALAAISPPRDEAPWEPTEAAVEAALDVWFGPSWVRRDTANAHSIVMRAALVAARKGELSK